MNFFIPLFFLIFPLFGKTLKTIELTPNNVLTIKDTIDEASASNFIYDLNRYQNKSNIYVYLDTNGGSVDSGNKILREIQKYNMSCIAEKAYSMGFVLFQGCDKRYITRYGKLMQHQISYGIRNEKEKINNYARFIDEIDEEINLMQARKIKMDVEEFKYRTLNEWWTFGKNTLKYNLADKMVDVFCNTKITKENVTKAKGSYDYIYSKCPLIHDPIDKKKNGEPEYFFLFQ